jgi:hypothetical protein
MRYQLFILVALILSCNQRKVESDNSKIALLANNADSSLIIGSNNANDDVIFNATIPQVFIIPSNKTTTIIGAKKVKLTINTSNVETISGGPLGNTIEVQLKEMVNQKDLFLNDAQTVSNGKLLVSGGVYHIALFSNGEELRIKSGKTLSLQIPKNSQNEMELFYAERNADSSLNWVKANEIFEDLKIEKDKTVINTPTQNQQVEKVETKPAVAKNKPTYGSESFITDSSISIKDFIDSAKVRNNRMSMEEFKKLVNLKTRKRAELNNNDTFERGDISQKIVKIKDSATGKVKSTIELSYYTPVEIKNLGWINCDRFYNKPSNGTIECNFDSSNNFKFVTVYLIFKNINSLLKENIDRKLVNGNIELYNKLPTGESIKLIAIAKQNGKYFSYKEDFVATSNKLLQFKFSPEANMDVATYY